MEVLDLPPGFRFHPTDEEIITYYLTQKVINGSFSATAIGEADFNKCEPWDLPQKAKMGEKEWYFFCQRDRKYPTGMRTNRATESGYWKATGKDREIFQGKSCLVGMKKTLVFYKGRAPKGEKTNWVMHEFRLHGKFPYHHHHHHSKDEWVVCRVFHKNVTAEFRRFQVPAAVLPPLLDPTDHFNVGNGSFPSSVFKQPIIENFSQIPINVGQIRANNNSEFISFSPEKIMNYYVNEQQPMGTRPVIASAAVSSFIDIRRHEQHSMSMMTASQDTGLSPEMNNTKAPATEISSVDNACYEDFDGAGDISDLDHLWEY